MNQTQQTISRLHKIWWVPLITGLLCIALGVWCFIAPAVSLEVFSYVFAGCITVAGALNLCYAYTNSSVNGNWGWSLTLGLIEIICGIWLFTMPAATLAVAFAYAMGIWVLVSAICSVSEALFFSRYSLGWTIFMVILLALTIVAGIFFLTVPLLGGILGWLWIGCSLCLFGLYRMFLSFKVRSITDDLP